MEENLHWELIISVLNTRVNLQNGQSSRYLDVLNITDVKDDAFGSGIIVNNNIIAKDTNGKFLILITAVLHQNNLKIL